MKLNRWFAMAAIALVVVAAMGLVTSRSSAWTPALSTTGVTAAKDVSPALTNSSSSAQIGHDYQGAEVPRPADAVLQAKPAAQSVASDRPPQSALQTSPQQGANTKVAGSGSDTNNIQEQVSDQSGPDTQVENGAEGEGSDGQDEAPTGTPAITADAARAAAEAYLHAGPASKVSLDDENGQLIYSVEIGTSDVKVDAMTGAVLRVDSGGEEK